MEMNDILSTFVRSHRGKRTISEAYLQGLITEQHLKFEEIVCKQKSMKQLAITGELYYNGYRFVRIYTITRVQYFSLLESCVLL